MDIETPPPDHSRHQLYRLLLLAYPRRFRDACGPEMEAVFDQRQRELAGRGPVAQIRFWIETAADIALSAVPEWLTTATDILRPRSHQLDKGQRMDSLIQDLRYALRTLRRAPLFTVVAAITIGVGIGATTTVFSVANSFLLRAPAGVRASSELVTAHRLAEDGSTFHSFSYPLYTDLQRASSGLTSLAAYGIFPVSVTTADEPQLLLGMIVSGNYFQTIQTRAALGRLLLPSDDRGAGGADPVAVLSYRTWLRRFSGDSSIIGRSILLNRQPFTVVGVAEAGFQGHTVAMDAGVWVPLGMYPQISNGERLDVANSSWLEMIGRRRGSVTATQIGQALTAAAAVNAERPRKIDVRTYAPVPAQALLPVGGFLALLLAICGTVLFIGSVNVGGLLLSRATARSREIAIRLAVGAGRSRVVRQLLTESVALFCLGGIIGTGLTIVATRALEGFSPPLGMPIHFDLHPDFLVLGLALGVSLLTGVVFGLAPALQSTRPDLSRAMRDEYIGDRFHHSRLRNVFVTVQVAGSVLLLAVGGLFVRALSQAGAIDLGFKPQGVYATQVDLSVHHYTQEERARFAEQVRSRLEARPEIQEVAAIDVLPLNLNNQSTVFTIDGREAVPDVGRFEPDFSSVTPGYFNTMGMPLTRGRDFGAEDRTGAPMVGIVNEALARRAWPGEDAVGKQIRFGGFPGGTPLEIIGVARNSKYRSLGEDPLPMIYLPYAQQSNDRLAIVARSAAPAAAVGALIRDAIREADRDLPLVNQAPLLELIGVSLLPNRIAALLAGAFGAVGLVLAAVGLYGLLSYAVSRRRREIGIRMALGAAPGDVRRLVLKDGLRLTAIGLVVGLVLALAVTHLLRKLLFGVSPVDPLTLIAIAALLGITAAIACALPARRATRTDPMEALRHE